MVSGSVETEIRNDPENGEWVSRAEYMERTGAQERTLTNWINQGTVKSRIIEVEVNGKMRERRQVFLPHKKTAPEKNPESFQQIAGSNTGSDAGSSNNDPEANLQQLRKLSIVEVDPSRNHPCVNCELLKADKDRLQGQIDLLKDQLKEVEIAKGRLEGEMSGMEKLLAERQKLVEEKEETIKAKEQAINAANGMVLLYEKQANPALETESGAIPESPETNRNVPVKSSGWKWPWSK